MDSKTAKRAATANNAALEFDRDDKVWVLVTANNVARDIQSAELKEMTKDSLVQVIGEMVASTERKRPGRKPTYPVKVIPARWPNKKTPISVVLPQEMEEGGQIIEGFQNKNYFFFMDEAEKPKCIRKTWEGVAERFDGNTLDLSWGE